MGRVVEVLKSSGTEIWSLKYIGETYFGTDSGGTGCFQLSSIAMTGKMGLLL